MPGYDAVAAAGGAPPLSFLSFDEATNETILQTRHTRCQFNGTASDGANYTLNVMRKQEGAEEVLHLARYDDDDVAITTLHAHYFDGAGRGVARDKPVCRGFNATHDRASYVARATKLASELEALDGVRGYHYGDGAAIGTKTGAKALDVFVEVETLRALEWSDFCRSGVARHDRLSYVRARYVARDAATARAADRTVADPGGAAHAVASASGCDAACATWVAGAANYEKVAAAFLGPTTAAMIASGVVAVEEHRRSGSLDTQLLQPFQPERLHATVRTRVSLVATMSATMRCII